MDIVPSRVILMGLLRGLLHKKTGAAPLLSKVDSCTTTENPSAFEIQSFKYFSRLHLILEEDKAHYGLFGQTVVGRIFVDQVVIYFIIIWMKLFKKTTT